MKLYTCVYESCEVRIGPKSTLKFANFVKPKTDLVRAIRWVSLTGRSDFKTKDIDRFIASISMSRNNFFIAVD